MIEKKYHKEAFERADDKRKNLILEVGIEEFSSKGYENANINIIAKNAGISIGLMYKYFATKEDLFITCLKRGMSVLEKSLDEIMVSEDKLLIKAEKLIRTICQHSKKYSNYIKMYNEISSRKDTPDSISDVVEEIESKRSSIYITSISQAINKGDIRSDIDPRMLALFLDSLLTTLQFAYTCNYYKEKFKVYTDIDIEKLDEEQIVTQLLRFIESAFTYETK